MNALSTYRPRLADRRLRDLVSTFPAVLVNGPRAAGKTTTASQLCADVARLDQPARAQAFRADPDAALRLLDEPALIDEWQEVPEVLGAVKRAVDADSRPGRFILTGSVRAALQQQMWPGTGRIVQMPMYGLTEREVSGAVDPDRPAFLDRLATGRIEDLSLPPTVPDVNDYVEVALRSGFPEVALRGLSEDDRRTWLEGYLEQLLGRDVETAGFAPREPERLRRYVETIALNTAGTPSDATVYAAAGVNARTATAYDALLASLFVTDRVPAWHSNRLSRLVATPKRYVVEPALVGSALGLTAKTVLTDGDLLGRIVDTFVVAQLRPETALSARRHRFHHVRTRGGREEVDLLVELDAGHVIGIEIKASAAPKPSDARHLVWLRDRLGERFLAGAVLHTGPSLYQLDERISAVPICAIWG